MTPDQIELFVRMQNNTLLKAVYENDKAVLEDLIKYENTDLNEVLVCSLNPLKMAPPLTIAISFKNKELVEILLKNKANPNIADSDGVTPLMLAANRADIKTMKSLIENGASLTAVDDEGIGVIDYAKNAQVVAYLLSKRLKQPNVKVVAKRKKVPLHKNCPHQKE